MIYGLMFGATLFLVAFTHELIPFYYVLLGGMVCIAIVAIVNMQSAKKVKTPPAPVATVPDTPTSTTSAAATPPPPIPAPVSVASARSYGWVWWWLIIVIAITVVGRWVWYETQGVKSTYSPPQATAPGRELQQKFSASIDPLGFSREKSRGVRVEKTDGFTTIIVKPEPEGELVYDFYLASASQRNGFFSADYYLREILPQYAGYRINDIRHNEEYLFGSGLTRLGPELREFKAGKNEFALFSKGELRINGDKNIAIYQR